MGSTLRIEDEPLPLGPLVRREYFKLPEDLAMLTAGFGIKLPAACRRDATILVFAIECMDRFLDAIPPVKELFSL